MKKTVLAMLILIFCVSSSALAWWSITAGSSTHYKLSDNARGLLSSDYADMKGQLGSKVSWWTSGPTDDANAHGGTAIPNGGPIADWWEAAQEHYKKGEFSGDWSSYYYIALMTHLVEDQAVPAHAYNIQHGGIGNMDNMEQLVDNNYHPDTHNIETATSPYSNYNDMKFYTLSITADTYWRKYWLSGFPHDYVKDGVTYHFDGIYGPDAFPWAWIFAGTAERNITNQITGAAVGYAAGALVAISEKLPPIVKDLAISSSTNCNNLPSIGKQSSLQISFKMMENRKKSVKIFLTADGEPIINSEYGTGKSYDLSSGSDLPWEGTYTINWDGRLASGQYPSDGDHTLSVKIVDEDGNESEVLQKPFAVDTTPPTINISGASNGAVYYMPVSLTVNYSVTDNKDPNPQITFASYPSGAVFDSEGSYSVVVKAKDCAGNEDTKSLSFRIAKRPRPDDTYSISDGTPPPIVSDPFAKVAVLNRGMIGSMAAILSNLKEPYSVIDLPVDPAKLASYPLLIIPSDGLNGLDNVASFKDALQQYAQNGGVILSLTQERGYMFDALPGDWQGAGYLEEDGCITYAGGIENDHIIFSGQDSVYFDANADGYLTGWPKEGKVLARRTKNAMPLLISYPLGEGIVLASTLYSDYGYLSGQINLDEKRLIRDIISWGKDIKSPINAYNAGSLVKESVTIQNKGDVDAHSVTYNFYDPDKKLVYSYDEPIASPLSPGQLAHGDIAYQLPASNCPLGIYWMKYTLKDADGNLIQEEQPTSRFAVKANIGTVNISKDVNVVVKTGQPFYPIGSTGSFQVVLYNSRATDMPVRVKYGTNFHSPVYSGSTPGYSEQVIPAGGSVSFDVDVAALSRGDYFSAAVLDLTGRSLAFSQEKFYVFYPSVKGSASTDKPKYLPEESGTLSYSLSYDFLRFINKASYEVTANIRILDQAGTKVSESTKTLLLTGNSFSDSLAFTTPAQGGRYVAQVEILSYGKRIGLASTYFEVLTRDFLTIAPHYPATWMIGGDNSISFDVRNASLSTLPAGAIKYTLYDPDNVVVGTEEKQFLNLPAGDATTQTFAIPLAQGKFGIYRLKYELSYLGNRYEYYADFSNQVAFDLTFDKLSYKMRENMLLQLDIINNGVFEGDVGVKIDIPSFGYSDTRNVRLSKSASVPYTISVPATISSGTHTLNTTLSLQNQIARSYQFGVPPSRLTLGINKTSFAAGDTGTINVSNTGGVDTNFQISIKLFDKNGNPVNETTATSSVQASSSQGINFTVPPSAVSGNYLVQTECKNLLKGNEVSTLSELITVSGLTGTVEVKTDKKTYLASDLKNILTNIVNTSGSEIANGTLRLRVYAQTECTQPPAPSGGSGGGGQAPYIYPMVPDQFLCSDTQTYNFNLHPYEHGGEGQQITPKVLLIEDADSWSTGYQNEAVLNSLNIPYTRIASSQLAATDIYQYTHIIIPSDQPQSMYNNLDLNMSRVTGWIQEGGSFQFNACDVGWAGGHWTYGPASLRHVYPVYVQQNYIRTPDHPILQGMTNSNFYNWNYVSHGYFTGVPANAQILLSVNSDGSQPTLIDYTLGNGHIVASQNTLEWANAGNGGGNNRDILDNIIKYMFQIGFDTLKWSVSDVDPSLMSISVDQATDMMRIIPVQGKYGADQVMLTLTDKNGLTATQWINVAISPYLPTGNLLWEKEIPVSVLNSLDHATEFDISKYNLTGKFYVEATLFSDIKQEIAKDIDSFYVINSDLGLEMETDKAVYKPGETVTVTAKVTNHTAVTETGLSLVLAKDGGSFHTVTFDLAAGETRTFTKTVSSNASFLLAGAVKGVKVVDHVAVESPQVVMTVSGPGVVGFESFELVTKLENKGRTSASLTINFADELHSVTLPVDQSVSFRRTFAITNTTTYSITLSGDVSRSQTKTVTFGTSAGITLSPQSVYPEGAVSIPCMVANTGTVDTGFTVSYTLKDATSGETVAEMSQPVYLLASSSISDILMFDELMQGSYILTYTSPVSSGTASFRVAKFNQITIDSMTVGNTLTPDGRLPITATLRNTGAGSFIGNVRLDTGFYSEVRPISLAVNGTTTVTTVVPLNVGPGDYEATVQALYNYVPVAEASRTFTLEPKFSLLSMPNKPVFMAGDFGEVTLLLKNEGLLGGMAEVAIKNGDMIDVMQADQLSAGEQKQFAFKFHISEDIMANWYNAVVSITNLETGTEQEVPLSYYVQGYDIGVSVKTDQPCYREGDTANLTLNIANNTDRGVELDGLVSFNDYFERQMFSLGGKPVLEHIDTTTSSGDVLLGKISKFAETDMGVFDSNAVSLTGGGTASYSYAWTYDQNGDIWTYGWSSGPLSKFNGKTGAFIKNVYIPYYSLLQIAVDKDGRMYGGDYWSNYIYVFNPETGAAIASHQTPNGGYVAGVFWDGEYLWFGERRSSGNRYYRVDVSGGSWNILNTFTSTYNSYGYGMGIVDNRLLISNSTSDSFLYHTDMNFTNNSMSSTYKSTPRQSWDDFTSFNYNGTHLQRKGYYSNTIRNYKAYSKAYAPSGTIVSSVLDVTSTDGAVLSWDATTPAGTSITVETRTGNTLNPDTTWSAWSVQENGKDIPAATQARHVQYKISLATTDDAATPALHGITLQLPTQGRQIAHTSQEDFEKMPVSLAYAVPVNFTGQKLFYGIYTKAGWGIHLNSMHVCEATGDLLIYTDKQVYASGEMVTVHVYPYNTGTLKISAPGYQNTFTILNTDHFEVQFKLPSEMTTGAYSIDADFLGKTLSHHIDVTGYTFYIDQTVLDKSEYSPGDTMKTDVTVSSDRPLSGLTAMGLVYAGGQSYTVFEKQDITIAQGATTISLQGALPRINSGFAELTIILFKSANGDPYGLFLGADSKGFDVLASDNTPPVSHIIIGNPKYETDGKLYVSGSTQIRIEATDEGSGVARTEYRIDNGQWLPYAPFTLPDENSHTISYRSVDIAGNPESIKQLDLILDKTPPTTIITASDPLVAGSVNTVSPRTTFTLTASDNLAGVKTIWYRIDDSQWQIFSAGFTLAGMKPGSHTIYLNASDNVGNDEAERSITVRLVQMEVKKEISTESAVLVGAWLDNLNKVKNESAVNTLKSILSTRGISYLLAENGDDFKRSFRSGKYNTYLLVDYKDEAVGEEVREAINYGDTLVFIKTRPDVDPALDEAFGVKFTGKTTEDDPPVTLLESKFSQAGTMQSSGKAVVAGVEADTASVFGYLKDKHGQYPALILNGYGGGKAMLFTFDILNSADMEKVAELIANSITLLKPEQHKVRALDSVPVRITVSNSTEPLELRVTETIPAGITADSITPKGAATDDIITWQQYLDASMKAEFGYFLNLPDTKGDYTVTTDVMYLNRGDYRIYETAKLTANVQNDSIDLLQGVIADLTGFTVAGSDDLVSLTGAAGMLSRISTNPLDGKEAEKDVETIIKVTKMIRGLSADTANIRLKLDELLKILERKWYLMQTE